MDIFSDDRIAGGEWQSWRARRDFMKVARILDERGGRFLLEYDNTLGKKHTMRLDALTYENALREAKSFLEIHAVDRDSEGTKWDIE